MENVNYTIAVMIYNVETFLPECINSVIKNPGYDVEILLIDDGSTDNSPRICDEYATVDSRITVLHKENGGVSSARNAAINNAKGKWLIMVDGDDVLTENAVEYGRKYLDDDSDVLQLDAAPFVNALDISTWKPKGTEMIVTGEGLNDYHIQLIDRSKRKIEYPAYNINPAWAKIWNMDFIRKNNLLYDESVHKGEGTLFTFKASYMMKKIRFIPSLFYGYRINPGSIMHRFNINVLEYNDVQMMQYKKIVKENGEFSNKDVLDALNERALYLIENSIHSSILHKDCIWTLNEMRKFARKLCQLPWVAEAVDYQKHNQKISALNRFIIKNDTSGLIVYCKCIRRVNFIKTKLKQIIGR